MMDGYSRFLLRMKEHEIDDLWEEIYRLQRENERLKEELKAMTLGSTEANKKEEEK